MKTRFPELLELARKREAMQFAIGDRLLKDCGAPSQFTRMDGSYEKIKAAAVYLEENGVEYSMTSLAHYREIAFKFPPERRYEGISWQAHTNAGDPDTLDAIVKAARKRKERVTVNMVRAARLAMQDAHVRAIEAREKAAGTYKELPARGQEPPNKFKHAPATEAQASDALAAIEVLTPALKAKILAADVAAILDQAELSEEGRAAAFERALEAATAWREIAEQLRKGLKKGGHLAVVA